MARGFRWARGRAKVRGPNRPTNIVIMKIHFPGRLSPGTIPVEVPLVPKADTVSKNRSRKGISGSVTVSVGRTTMRKPTPNAATVSARSTWKCAISLPKASASDRPEPRK